jgi:succinoglycan biosynthesis protein ExoV
MPLRYYAPTENFGDALNGQGFWEALLPNVADLAAQHDIFGVGTLLSQRFVASQRPKLILGSGCGYHSPARADGTWCVGWVRGPLTARTCGVLPHLALTDPAYLLPYARPDLPWRAHSPSTTVLMPHVDSDARADFKRLAQLLGYRYCSPTAPLGEIVGAFAGAKHVVSESLHGAILADTLRVPWTALVTHKRINSFKWRDFCASIGVSYEPVVLHRALIDSAPCKTMTRWRHRLEAVIARGLRGSRAFSRVAPWRSATQQDYERAAGDVDRFVRCRGGTLANERHIEMLRQRMFARLQLLATRRIWD